MENIYLCDIDGTLADFKGHRGPFDEHKVLDDVPLPTVGVIRALVETGARIIYFSGRTDKCYIDSSEWIFNHVGHNPELYMRKAGDFRSDDIIKEELYNKHIKDQYNVLGVFDDRLKVVRMWEKLGLWVFNCNQGNKEF